MRRITDYPYLLLTLTALFWAGNMITGRAVRAEVPPMTLALLRWIIALALFYPLARRKLATQWPVVRAGWPAVLLLGVLGVGSYNTLAYIALQYTTATNASLLNSFIPIATMALAWLLLGRHLKRVEAIGMLVSLCGVCNIISQGNPLSLLHLQLNTGDLWMLLAVLVWGLYTVGLHWKPGGLDPMVFLFYLTIVGILTLLPAVAWEWLVQGRRLHPSLGAAAAVLYTGTLPGFLGYIFYNTGVAAVGPSKASLFIHLMPVFGTLLAAVFLGERPHSYHFVGIGLVFLGIWLTTRRS